MMSSTLYAYMGELWHKMRELQTLAHGEVGYETALLHVICNARLRHQHLLRICFLVLFVIMTNSDYPSHPVRNKLYISHFLSTWNSRLFEFGAVLFISTIFPGTLFPASIYALTRSASVVVFSTAIGHLIDRSERIFLIRLSISKSTTFVNITFFCPLDHFCLLSLFLNPILLVIISL